MSMREEVNRWLGVDVRPAVAGSSRASVDKPDANSGTRKGSVEYLFHGHVSSKSERRILILIHGNIDL